MGIETSCIGATGNATAAGNIAAGSNGATGTINVASGGTLQSTDAGIIAAGGTIWVNGTATSQGDTVMYDGQINIENGVMYVSGDASGGVQWYIDLGVMTAWNGTGTVAYDYDTTTPGYTTIYAVATADFDGDGDVDGNDFLKWQQDGGSAAELDIWKAQLGATGVLSSATMSGICSF